MFRSLAICLCLLAAVVSSFPVKRRGFMAPSNENTCIVNKYWQFMEQMVQEHHSRPLLRIETALKDCQTTCDEVYDRMASTPCNPVKALLRHCIFVFCGTSMVQRMEAAETCDNFWGETKVVEINQKWND